MGLGARLTLLLAGVAAATALIVGTASYVTTDRQVSAEVDDFLLQRAGEISQGQREQPRDRRDRGTEQPVISVSPDAEVQTLNDNGDIDANTGVLLPVDDTDRTLAEKNTNPVIRTVSVDGQDYRMITEHLEGGGAVQVARSLEESAGLLNDLRTRILAITAVIASIAGLVGWLVARRTTRPLEALTDVVDQVAETQDLEVPIPEAGGDEVGRLAKGFNRMLGALRLSQEQQRRLVQDAAHELRTPLTSVTANVDWLARASDLDEQTRRETLSGIGRELRELNDLMSEIIQLATHSRETPSMVETDLTAVVRDAAARFTRRTDRVLDVSASPVVVRGDADSLDRAVTNLLSNADKYSPSNSPIALEVGPAGVFVDDAGPGIAPEETELVFHRFYRSAQQRSEPGSGLGLSIVEGIVGQHGGRVVVDRSRLGGARVGFTLPSS